MSLAKAWKMLQRLAAVASLLWLGTATWAIAGSPTDAVRSALADLSNVPQERHRQTRWLFLSEGEEKSDGEISAANYILNAVSRSRIISTPELVGDTLLRIDLAAYSDLKNPTSFPETYRAWENLAVADPYFHVQTQIALPAAAAKVKPPAGIAPAKAAVVKDAVGNTVVAAVQQVTTDGSWIDAKDAAALREATGSIGAVLRADWVIAQLCSPGPYYEFAGVPTKETEFFKVLGLSLDDVNRLAADSAANMFKSAITSKPRRVVLRPIPWGSVFITQDVAKESPDKDAVRNPVTFKDQKYNFDASEIFFQKANGLWGFALYDAAGNRQNAVPPEIATDHAAPAGHQQLTPPLSCIRCHELHGGVAGMQPLTDEQILLPPLDLARTDPQVAVRVAELYNIPKLRRQMDRARQDYEDAVEEAATMTTKEAATVLNDVFSRHVYSPVTLPTTAAEVGLEPDELGQALAGTTDPILLAISAGRQVNRRAWESSFQEAAMRALSFGQEPGEPAEPGELAQRQPLKALVEVPQPVAPVVKIGHRVKANGKKKPEATKVAEGTKVKE